ncbi:hypothetical protein NIES2101_38105 [Calothrix sp. HK-06]|nr:hypothetical protein NIES2101_38105 [Calothrix sp. HK-06]
MSLLSFMQEPNNRDRFRQEFKKPKLTVNQELLAPPLTKNYQLVGTAFDYLLRFLVQRLNPQAQDRGWVAETSTALLSRSPRLHHLYDESRKIVDAAKSHHALFLKTGEFTDELLRHTLLLSKIDAFTRAGIIDENLQQIDDLDIQDLKNLIAVADPNQFKSTAQVFINPGFGIASASVGGADADLILGDLLVEIKVTKLLEFKLEYFDQLMGYFTLSILNQKYEHGHYDSYDIKRIGIYFARHGYLHIMNIEDIVNLATFPSFLEWFELTTRGSAA